MSTAENGTRTYATSATSDAAVRASATSATSATTATTATTATSATSATSANDADGTNGTRPTVTGDVALALVDVTVTLGGRVIIEPVTLSFAADRVHAVIGRSGAGKSVLMKAVAGLLPRRGVVRVLRPPLVLVHQDPALLDELDVEENVAFAVSRRRDIPKSERTARIDESLHALSLTELRRRMPSSLTVAVQKRVALARALALRPGILVVDEPTTGLDPLSAAGVDEALASLRGTTIVITHSPRTLARLRPDIVVVDAGRVFRRERRAA